MTEGDPRTRLIVASGVVRQLQQELRAAEDDLAALVLEVEDRAGRQAEELHLVRAELERTTSELLQLTVELEDRVAARTAELEAKNDEVRAMSQQLWQTAKLATMGELAASIAHELNNPLAIVALRAESLLGRTAPGDADRHSLEVIGGEVERMATLVANLLQFSRRSTPEISSVDVGEEIVRTMDLVHYYLRNRGIAIVRDFAADAPMIRADRQQLRQLFLNLITNAADAMASGGTLTASVATAAGETLPEEPEPEPDQRPILSGVAVEIRDTGTGIASENLSRILDPFFTTKPEGKGTGLGLAICRRIVHEHEGTIQVASELGRGTTVRIVFPLTMTQRSLL